MIVLAVMVVLAIVFLVSATRIGYFLHETTNRPDDRLAEYNLRDSIVAAVMSGIALGGLLFITAYNP